jgi:hypothetical protein
MRWYWGGKRIRFGPLIMNVSKSGVSWTIKLGRYSWNSRRRKHRIDTPGPGGVEL